MIPNNIGWILTNDEFGVLIISPWESEMVTIRPELLGDAAFKSDYGIIYAYVSGAMYKGISSPELVIKMAKAGLIGYLGTGGLKRDKIESHIKLIQSELNTQQSYGMNLLCNLIKPEVEEQTVDLYLLHGIKRIEAAAYMHITPAVVHFRLKGIHLNSQGTIEIPNQIIAKVSRPEIASLFMNPAPEGIVRKLVELGKLTNEEASLSEKIPLSHDICLESDSGGHTDRRVALTLIPSVLELRDRVMSEQRYQKKIRVGAAGGIGTPQAAAAVFVMGVDFILTGSINQCTVEAGISSAVKDRLQDIDIQDTTYAPAGDMFEIGAQTQVLRKGLLFPARANKLYDLYSHHQSIEEIDESTQKQIQERYFKRSFSEVWEETKAYLEITNPNDIVRGDQNPKYKMALIFRWYFIHTTRLALNGGDENSTDFQVHCGSAMGAFNQWVKGTSLENWRNRHVDEIAKKLMDDTAEILTQRFHLWSK